MSVSVEVYAVRDVLSQLNPMLQVIEACTAAGVSIPNEVSQFFGPAWLAYGPDAAKLRASMEKVMVPMSGDPLSEDGGLISLDNLPDGTRSIRIFAHSNGEMHTVVDHPTTTEAPTIVEEPATMPPIPAPMPGPPIDQGVQETTEWDSESADSEWETESAEEEAYDELDSALTEHDTDSLPLPGEVEDSAPESDVVPVPPELEAPVPVIQEPQVPMAYEPVVSEPVVPEPVVPEPVVPEPVVPEPVVPEPVVPEPAPVANVIEPMPAAVEPEPEPPVDLDDGFDSDPIDLGDLDEFGDMVDADSPTTIGDPPQMIEPPASLPEAPPAMAVPEIPVAPPVAQALPPAPPVPPVQPPAPQVQPPVPMDPMEKIRQEEAEMIDLGRSDDLVLAVEDDLLDIDDLDDPLELDEPAEHRKL